MPIRVLRATPMKFALLVALFALSGVLSPAQSSQALAVDQSRPLSAGRLVARPFSRAPPFDAPTDPVLCFNAESQKWYMYYTARRATAADAPGVTWVHGSTIGMAESA